MASKNRFKQAAPAIDFDDPSVLTAVPAPTVEEKIETPSKQEPEVKREEVRQPVVEVPVKEEPKVETIEVVDVPEKQPEPEKEEEKKDTKENLLAGILEQKMTAKTYALYLEADVVAELDKLAKRNKVSRSKALNSLLRSILIK